MNSQAELYRNACGMKHPFSLTLRHVASGARFEHKMTTPTILVGCDRRCDVRLPEKLSAKKELLIQVVDGRIFCLALGDSEDVRQRIRRRAVGDSGLEINEFEIHAFEDAGADAEVERPVNFGEATDGPLRNRFELAVRNEGRKAVVPLKRTVTVMGRSPRCQVCFTSAAASHFHAACISTPSGVWVVDLGSRTGTFVDEIPVRFRRLEVGCRLRIGLTRFEFRAAAADSESVHTSSPAEIVGATDERALVAANADPAGGEVATLVSTLVRAMSQAGEPARSNIDAHSIVRVLNDMVRMQSLQLDEIRRLNTYLAAHPTSAAAMLEGSAPASAPPSRPTPAPIKPTGRLSGPSPDPGVHEWFQEENSDMAEESSVARVLKRILGASRS